MNKRELKEELKKTSTGRQFLEDTEPCEDAISREDLPPVIPTQRWIPVSERLPENETRVLTTIKIPNRIARVRSGWYDGGFFHNDNGDVWKATDMEVLAWMPLPEPYKEGEDKK